MGNTVIGELYRTLLLKLRADGLIVWQKSIPQVRALDILETSTEDFILAGDRDWIKLDSQGDLLWQHEFGEPSYHIGPITRLVEEGNGNIVVEAVDSRAVFNADGELQSFNESDAQPSPENVIDRLDENQKSDMFFFRTTADGGALLGNRVVEDVGDVASMLSSFLISRFSEDGSVRWQKSHGGYFGPASYEDVHVFETKSADFIVAGTLSYYGNNAYRDDLWVLRLGSDGNSQWDKLYATEGEDPEGRDAVAVIQELSNGDLIFAGQTSGAGTGDQDMWILKTNAQGEISNCSLVFDSSVGTFGNFPEVETTTLENEQKPFVADARVIPLCSPSP